MTDTMPLWFALPLAALLWGYLAADTITRRLNRKKELVDTIVIAKTKSEGTKRFPRAVAVVTPRSTNAARGFTAHRIVVLDSMRDHPDLERLIEDTKPSLIFRSIPVKFA